MKRYMVIVFLVVSPVIVGCGRDVEYVSAFWPGFRGYGQQCVPEFAHELESVVLRYDAGRAVESNLARNVRGEILSFKKCPITKIVGMRQVSPYAILAHGISTDGSGTASDWLFLIGCENVVEVVGYYDVTHISRDGSIDGMQTRDSEISTQPIPTGAKTVAEAND